MRNAMTAVQADGRYLAAPSHISRVTETAQAGWPSRPQRRGAHVI